MGDRRDDGEERRLGFRATFGLTVLLPLLGLVVFAGIDVRQRLDLRAASAALEDDASRLGEVADFLAALAREEVLSTVGALRAELDLGEDDPDRAVLDARLAGARALVDSDRFADLRRQARLAATLTRLRADVDSRRVSFGQAGVRFTALDELLDGVWRSAMSRVEHTADDQPLPASVRARVRALRESMNTFTHADDRIAPALALLLGPPRAADLVAALDAGSRFSLSEERARADAGPRARTRWALFDADPAVHRLEAVIELAVDIGAGDRPPFTTVDTAAWTQGLDDGWAWADRLSDVVRAAALDLEAAAAARAADETRAVWLYAAALVVVAAATATLGAVIARRVSRPASDLERAARRIQAGELALPEVPVAGPRELAATVRAFNDMASTLAAVEERTVALAEGADDELLDRPLPGRTGRSLQRGIDRLRRSISEDAAQRAELEERASHDDLTGLLNRATAMVAIERELARAARAGDDLLALYVDLDGLKALNDTHGHEAGDQAIVRTAEALRATTRDADIVARLGGDEFLVVGPVPTDGRPGIEAFAERMRAAVSLQAVPVGDGGAVPLRCSIGLVRSRPGEHTAAGLVREADVAMYRAKRRGRDRVVWVDSSEGAPRSR